MIGPDDLLNETGAPQELVEPTEAVCLAIANSPFGSLTGCCIGASLVLQFMLHRRGIRARLLSLDGPHTVVAVGEWVLDPTPGQFGDPLMLVYRRDGPHQHLPVEFDEMGDLDLGLESVDALADSEKDIEDEFNLWVWWDGWGEDSRAKSIAPLLALAGLAHLAPRYPPGVDTYRPGDDGPKSPWT